MNDGSGFQKRRQLLEMLDAGLVMLHLDPRPPDVIVPARFKSDPVLRLNLAYQFRLPSLDIGVEGVYAVLSFDKQNFGCTVPWSAIFAVTRPNANHDGIVWPESVPEELKSSFTRAGVDEPTHLRTSAPTPGRLTKPLVSPSAALPRSTPLSVVPSPASTALGAAPLPAVPGPERMSNASASNAAPPEAPAQLASEVAVDSGQPFGPSAEGDGQPFGPSAEGDGQPFGPSAEGDMQPAARRRGHLTLLKG